MRAVKTSVWFLASVLVLLRPDAGRSADSELEVHDWRLTANNTASGNATIDARFGVGINVILSCGSGRVNFTVKVVNGDFDVATTQNLQKRWGGLSVFGPNPPDTYYMTEENHIGIGTALEGFKPQYLTLETENSTTFSFASYDTSYFLRSGAFYIRLSVNRTEEVLRIPLKEETVVKFLSQCLRVDRENQQKENAAKTHEEENNSYAARIKSNYETLCRRADNCLKTCIQQYSATTMPNASIPAMAAALGNCENACPSEPNMEREYNCAGHRFPLTSPYAKYNPY